MICVAYRHWHSFWLSCHSVAPHCMWLFVSHGRDRPLHWPVSELKWQLWNLNWHSASLFFSPFLSLSVTHRLSPLSNMLLLLWLIPPTTFLGTYTNTMFTHSCSRVLVWKIWFRGSNFTSLSQSVSAPYLVVFSPSCFSSACHKPWVEWRPYPIWSAALCVEDIDLTVFFKKILDISQHLIWPFRNPSLTIHLMSTGPTTNFPYTKDNL